MLKKIIRDSILIIQRILIAVSLTIVYFFCFTATWLFALLVKRKILTDDKKDKNTFWIEAEGYEVDIADSMRQS